MSYYVDLQNEYVAVRDSKRLGGSGDFFVQGWSAIFVYEKAVCKECGQYLPTSGHWEVRLEDREAAHRLCKELNEKEENLSKEVKELIEAVGKCHTHPGKERTLDGYNSYNSRVGHSHVIIDEKEWNKVRRILLTMGIIGG